MRIFENFAVSRSRSASFELFTDCCHVRLARADPDFAREDVVESDLVLPLDGHRVGPADRKRVERHLPFAVAAGRR